MNDQVEADESWTEAPALTKQESDYFTLRTYASVKVGEVGVGADSTVQRVFAFGLEVAKL